MKTLKFNFAWNSEEVDKVMDLQLQVILNRI